MFGATGMPRSRSTALNRSLSMQSADAVTPEPTYGTPASSSRPCTVPSSPNGPCRIGSTTSTAPSAAGRRRRRHRAGCATRLRQRRAGRQPGGERPGPVPADLDHLGLVAGGVERLDDRTRRGKRDLVLARAAAREHGHAQPRASRRWRRSRRRVGRRRGRGRRPAARRTSRRTASRPCSGPAGCCRQDPGRSRRRRTSRRRSPAASPSP